MLTQLQQAYRAGRLLEAHQAARSCVNICADDPDPALKAEAPNCEKRLPEIKESIPTVVLSVTDANGALTTTFQVTLDGTPLTDGLDGKAIELDPGSRTFVFTLPGLPPKEVVVPVGQGQKNQKVEVSFESGSKATSSTSSASTPFWPFLVGGGGLALGGVAAGLAASTLSSSDEFYELCPEVDGVPACANEADLAAANDLRDGIRARNGAAIGLGAAGAALLVTGIIGLAIAPSDAATTGFLIIPTVDEAGAVIGLSGRF